jgi:hypothetical protein
MSVSNEENKYTLYCIFMNNIAILFLIFNLSVMKEINIHTLYIYFYLQIQLASWVSNCILTRKRTKVISWFMVEFVLQITV